MSGLTPIDTVFLSGLALMAIGLALCLVDLILITPRPRIRKEDPGDPPAG